MPQPREKGVRFYRPQTSTELSHQATSFAYDPRTPLSYWLRYADALRAQADDYARHGEEQYAFMLYSRYRTLVLDRLPSHPDIRGAASISTGTTVHNGKTTPRDVRDPRYARDLREQRAQKAQRGHAGLARASAVADALGYVVDRLGPSIDRRARHFSDAGRGVEVQTATEKGMPPPPVRARRRPRAMQQVADAFGLPRNHY